MFKLLISFVDRDCGDAMVALTKEAGARGGTVIQGRSVEGSALMRALALGDTHKDVVLTIMGEEAPVVLLAIKMAGGRAQKKIKGQALLLDVAHIFVKSSVAEEATPTTAERESNMDSGHILMVVIVNQGLADDTMTAARKAGARGGSIINARGTGTEEDAKFFGIRLVPEKEILLVVAPQEHVDSIARAIRELPFLSEPGGGILFSQKIEEFILLGN